MSGVNDTSSDRPQNPDDFGSQPQDAVPAEQAEPSSEEAPLEADSEHGSELS